MIKKKGAPIDAPYIIIDHKKVYLNNASSIFFLDE